jgi:hypothetical protein
MTCDPAGEIGLEEDVHRIAQANWPDRKDGVGADGAEGRLLLRSYSGSPLGTYVLRPRGASLFYPRDAWSVPLDTLQTRLSPQSGRGLSVEGGQAARLILDLTCTRVPISSLNESEQLYGTDLLLQTSSKIASMVIIVHCPDCIGTLLLDGQDNFPARIGTLLSSQQDSSSSTL